MIPIDSELWIRHGRWNPDAKANLFCAPYAGGSPGIFAGCGERLAEDINLCPILYPGRDIRLMEEVPESMEEMARSFVEENPHLFQRPYAFLGYCVGGLFAYEVICYAWEKYKVWPLAFFAVSFASPAFRMTAEEICPDMSREGIVRYLLENRIMTEEYATDETFLDYYLPIISGDLKAVNAYGYGKKTKMDCDVFAFYGNEDSLFTKGEKESLASYTEKNYQYCEVAGGHYCLYENQNQIIDLINEKMKEKLK